MNYCNRHKNHKEITKSDIVNIKEKNYQWQVEKTINKELQNILQNLLQNKSISEKLMSILNKYGIHIHEENKVFLKIS